MDEVNMNKHFYLPKMIVNRELSKSALALYPVLCSFADFKESNWFQLSIENLCKFSGMSTATVHKALNELESDTRSFRYVDDDDPLNPEVINTVMRKKESSGKRHYNLYKVEFYRGGIMDANKGKYWHFNAMIVETGLWAKLSTRAKALYMYLRANGIADVGDNEEWQDLAADGGFRFRKHDGVILNIGEISTNLKIRYDHVSKVLDELEENGFCEREGSYCLVGIYPQKGGWIYA